MGNKVIALIPKPSRFQAARQEAAERANLVVAANMLEEAEKRVGRARALIQQAVSMDRAPRHNAIVQATLSLREAMADLDAVIQEI